MKEKFSEVSTKISNPDRQVASGEINIDKIPNEGDSVELSDEKGNDRLWTVRVIDKDNRRMILEIPGTETTFPLTFDRFMELRRDE